MPLAYCLAADRGNSGWEPACHRRGNAAFASTACVPEASAWQQVFLRGTMPPGDENAPCLRATANDERDGPWESVIEAGTFPNRRSGAEWNAQPRCELGSWHNQLVIGRFGLV